MKLKSLRLLNFRSFGDLPIQFDDRLTVFVGSNGSGKTSILDALALALAPVLTRLPFEKRSKVPSIAPSDIRQTGDSLQAPFSRITATAFTVGSDPISWDRTKLRDQSPSTKKEVPHSKKDLKELYSYVDIITDAHNQQRPYTLPVFAFYGTNRAVNVPHYRLQKRTSPRYFSRLAGLDEALETKSDFRRAVAWFDSLEQRELREARDKGLTGFVLPSLEAVREAIKRTIPGIESPRIDSATGRFAVNTKDPTGTSIRLHLDQLSDGYQVVLGVVMDFALRLALAAPSEASAEEILDTEAILIIDEIDLHLHPTWQQRVIADFRAAFPRTQMIFTTHSPQVLTTIRKEHIRVLTHEKVTEETKDTWRAEPPKHSPLAQESADALAFVMNAHPRPPLPLLADLHAYEQLARAGKANTDEARVVLARLTAAGFEFSKADLDLFAFLAHKKKNLEEKPRG